MLSRTVSRVLAVAGISLLAVAPASAQNASPAPKPVHPTVCARGVRVFTEKSEIPTPYDTLSVPRSPTPIMVTNPEEAEAAELALRGRAGSVGATGVLITDEVSEDGSGGRTMRRSVTGVYVPSDSAKAQAACKS